MFPYCVGVVGDGEVVGVGVGLCDGAGVEIISSRVTRPCQSGL